MPLPGFDEIYIVEAGNNAVFDLLSISDTLRMNEPDLEVLKGKTNQVLKILFDDFLVCEDGTQFEDMVGDDVDFTGVPFTLIPSVVKFIIGRMTQGKNEEPGTI